MPDQTVLKENLHKKFVTWKSPIADIFPKEKSALTDPVIAPTKDHHAIDPPKPLQEIPVPLAGTKRRADEEARQPSFKRNCKPPRICTAFLPKAPTSPSPTPASEIDIFIHLPKVLEKFPARKAHLLERFVLNALSLACKAVSQTYPKLARSLFTTVLYAAYKMKSITYFQHLLTDEGYKATRLLPSNQRLRDASCFNRSSDSIAFTSTMIADKRYGRTPLPEFKIWIHNELLEEIKAYYAPPMATSAILTLATEFKNALLAARLSIPSLKAEYAHFLAECRLIPKAQPPAADHIAPATAAP